MNTVVRLVCLQAMLINVWMICGPVSSSIIEGGGYIFLYLCSQIIKQSISKETNCAEHDYMNMPPPPIIELATGLMICNQFNGKSRFSYINSVLPRRGHHVMFNVYCSTKSTSRSQKKLNHMLYVSKTIKEYLQCKNY